MTDYRKLYDHLVAEHSDDDEVRLTLRDIHGIVGRLPPLAWTDELWWANDPSTTQARKWMEARFAVSRVELNSQCIVFRRVQGEPADRRPTYERK